MLASATFDPSNGLTNTFSPCDRGAEACWESVYSLLALILHGSFGAQSQFQYSEMITRQNLTVSERPKHPALGPDSTL
jgi:hypothetical protein